VPIDTDLTVPQPEQSNALSNPLGLISGVMGIRGQAIEQQNQQLQGGILQQQQSLIQKQMYARQKFGEILAAAPTLDAGMSTASQDKDVAPYVTQEYGQMREGMLANQQLQNEVQTGATSGYDNLLKGLATSGGDPDRFNASLKAGLDLMSPTARARAVEATGDMVTSLTAGLPKDPAARSAAFQARVVGWGVAHGMSRETVQAIYGQPGTTDTGNVVLPTMTAPAQGTMSGTPGGTVSPVGPAISKGLAPERRAVGTGTGEYPAVAPAQVGQPPSAVPTGSPQAAALLSANPPPKALAGDGKPLIANPASHVTTTFDRAGQPTIVGPNKEGANQRITDFEGEKSLNEFNLANTGKATATSMDQAFDNLAKGGGWQVPGFAGNARNAIAAFGDTFAQITGEPLPFEPSKVTSWEMLNKYSMPLALSQLTQSLGVQKEAAQTIQSMMKSVPTIENTYLGGKLLTAGVSAMFDRSIDERNYIDYVRKINGGDIQGAAEKFNAEHPAQQYAENVLSKFGLVTGPGGGARFPDKAALMKAVQSGLVTREDARKIKAAQGFE
jgi:hypothetical protein